MQRSYIISPLRLHQFSLIAAPGRLAVIDASWFMPNSERKPHTEFLAKRIPSARFLNIDEVAEPHALGLKHMMPKERVFADSCGESFYTYAIPHRVTLATENLGIQPNTHVVMYGLVSSNQARRRHV
jgi:thiosulfate/3-mercaptopyruvate sulfurtransferase